MNRKLPLQHGERPALNANCAPENLQGKQFRLLLPQ